MPKDHGDVSKPSCSSFLFLVQFRSSSFIPHVNYWSEVAFAWGAQPRGQGDSAAHCCALEALADRKEADLEELENRDYEKWLLAQLRMAAYTVANLSGTCRYIAFFGRTRHGR